MGGSDEVLKSKTKATERNNDRSARGRKAGEIEEMKDKALHKGRKGI
jgi:hypothetical protein